MSKVVIAFHSGYGHTRVIAEAVARGPEESPEAGQAEEAKLVNGEIRIDPASPSWPLTS